MEDMFVSIGTERFEAKMRDDLAPATCAKLRSLLPFEQKLIHVRWSGEACWIPLGDLDLGLGFENATSYPEPGQFILYPGGLSETEMLLAYGGVRFSSKVGQLAGTPFLTITERLDKLAEIGRAILWGGAQDIVLGSN